MGESLLVGEQSPVAAGERWLDLGTGGGLPGLVLAVRYPETSFTLLDARAKKIQAVEQFAHELGLPNVRAVSGRGEVLARDAGFRETFNGVISRAVGSLATVLELSRGFVVPGGVIVGVRGPDVAGEVERVRPALELLRLRNVRVVEVEGTDRATWLVTMRAEGRSPESVPRGDGIPRARPLGVDHP